MIDAVKSAWALFLGLGFIMLGNGLQGSLVAIRAQFEVFDNAIIGTVMAGYFVGFFAGSVLVPRLVGSVGHVRVFGALASLASFGVLIYPLIIDPWVWFALRVLTGVCYAGLYIVCESWLNERATNETRGQLLAIYMVISLVGMAGGQYLLNLYSPADFQLFTVVSILISLSVIPVLISATRVPDFETPETMGPIRLYKASPLGVVTMVLVGMGAGVFMGMGPSYAYQQGLDVGEVSMFMSAVFIGGFLFTWPIGRLSDRFDRRTIIFLTATAAVSVAAFGFHARRREQNTAVCDDRARRWLRFSALFAGDRLYQRLPQPETDGRRQQHIGDGERHRGNDRAEPVRRGDGFYWTGRFLRHRRRHSCRDCPVRAVADDPPACLASRGTGHLRGAAADHAGRRRAQPGSRPSGRGTGRPQRRRGGTALLQPGR